MRKSARFPSRKPVGPGRTPSGKKASPKLPFSGARQVSRASNDGK